MGFRDSVMAFLDFMCIGVCQSYVRMANFAVGAMGVIVELVALWMLVSDPISKQGMEAFSELGSVNTVKWVMLFIGLLMLVAACIGVQFATTRSRNLGKLYLFFLLASFLTQFGLALVVGGTLSELKGLQEATTKAVSVETQEVYKNKARAKLVRNSFQEFSFPESGGCAVVVDEAPVQEEFAFARALSGGESPDQQCKLGKRAIKCRSDTLSEQLSDYCMEKNEKSADDFYGACAGCSVKFFDLYIKNGITDQPNADRLEKLQDLFGGPAGTAYCRCLSRFIDSNKRHSQAVMNFCWVLACFQGALLFSVVWLILCGPESQQAREHSPSTIEMNIGVQPPGGPMGIAGDPYSQQQQHHVDPYGQQQQQVAVMCPHDAGPGMLVNVTTSTGKSSQVRVPPGVMPGQMFTAFVPA